MTILVTGCTGFLGAPVVERFLARGVHGLRCLLRPSSRRDRLEAALRRYPDAKVERFVGSLASASAAAEAVDGVDVVVHLAAALRGAASDMFLNTVVTTRHLLEAIASRRGAPPKLIHVSSFGVYGVAGLPRGAVVDEHTPLEPHPERRDPYSQAKLRQEQLIWEYARKHAIPTTVLRPGVIYGPGGGAFSTRVGLNLFGVFLHLGGDNLLPLTYIDNCAEAIAVATHAKAAGESFNVVDDDLVTAARWLRLYKRRVEAIPSVRVPYAGLVALSRLVERYHRASKGQLPAVFTPYKSASTWGGNRFDNAKLKRIGWRPIVSTDEGLARAFEDLKARTANAS
jgi:nucleoside-diphosphate-sugar epimerase